MMLEVCKRFHFEAAHSLPYHVGKCRREHGHSYKVDICVYGPIQEGDKDNSETGMVIDFNRITNIMEPLIQDKFDHYNLNDVIAYPTAERLCAYIYNYLDTFALPEGVYLSKIRVWETEGAYVEWAV